MISEERTLFFMIFPKPTEATIRKEIRLFLYLLSIIFIVRIFFYGHFIIPSGSMKPTLLEGDMIIINRYYYGYSQFSLPLHNFIPFKLIKNRIGSSRTPKRGEVVVFTSPTDHRVDFIKRCVGLPGDTIELKRGILYINDKPCEYEKIEDFREPCPKGIPENIKSDMEYDAAKDEIVYARYVQTFPDLMDNARNPMKHLTIRLYDSPEFRQTLKWNNFAEYVVPEGHYFMMGDNTHGSADSREFGAVSFENVTAKAIFIFFSVKFSFDGAWYLPWTWIKLRICPRSDRLGVPIE